MQLNSLDWAVVVASLIVTFLPVLFYMRRSGRGTAEFFTSGRAAPWWLIGTSMVATTFSTDTPNLVTDFVRSDGVAKNWSWWAFLLTGMTTVFFFARLWRRCGMLTDLEFYELRYSGKSAAFLRGFRAIYLGLLFNCIIMASVTLAASKIAGVMLGWDQWQTVIVCAAICIVFGSISGLWGVLTTDLLQFALAMTGVIAAAWYALAHPAVGGLSGLLNNIPPETLMVVPALTVTSANGAWAVNWEALIPLLIMPLLVQWWSVWYPGAEPGGGSYVAQRMLAARSEKDALAGTLWFNLAHYALRPWPWIIVALCSMMVFPIDSADKRAAAKKALEQPAEKALVEKWRADPAALAESDRASIEALVWQSKGVTKIREKFPDIDPNLIGHDLAYPAMLTFLPHGLIGLLVASLLAAYVSTMTTHMNWGTSYLVNDFYRRFVRPDASERRCVWLGRIVSALLMVVSGLLMFAMTTAGEAFGLMLKVGAGTGLIYLLRWYWWRINAWSEITAMSVSFLAAAGFFVARRYGYGMADHWELLWTVVITTAVWVPVTLLTSATDRATLLSFVRLARPAGRGWAALRREAGVVATDSLSQALLGTLLGCVMIYAALFGAGSFIYGQTAVAWVFVALFGVSGVWLMRLLPRMWGGEVRGAKSE